MSSIKISQLPSIGTLAGTEEVLINDSGTSKKISTQPFIDIETAAETAQTAAEVAQAAAESASVSAQSSSNSASTSATNAATSATNASTSATNAATSATNAAASYDSFDDRYLGAKSSAPSTDNDGDALTAGVLYYDTTTGDMNVYTGSAWEVAYVSGSASGALLIANNLSDLNNASAARTNLGLDSAATTPSTDYATAAQGTLADSALQDLSDDTTPQLGGTLDLNSNDISGTGSIDITGSIDVSEHILFGGKTHGAVTHAEGNVYYDSTHKALSLQTDDSGLEMELGQNEYIRVYNNTGSTINKGTPIYLNGQTSGTPNAAVADASDATKYNISGLASADISDSSYGYVTVSGVVRDFDTSSLTAGARFFVGFSSPGTLVTGSPSYPNYPMCVGLCLVSNATTGEVVVEQQNHSVNSFRVLNDGHIGGDFTVEGDLTVQGSTTTASSESISIGSPFNYFNTGDTIGASNTTFTGSGLDDGTFTGYYNGSTSKTYYVAIDGTGPDTFKWSYNSDLSSPQATTVAITGSDQTLADGISIKFEATTGHTSGDKWEGAVAPVNVDTGWASNRNTGGTGVGYTHLGMFFDVSDTKFKLFDAYDPEPQGTINTADASFNSGTLVAGTVEANVTGNLTGNVTGNVTGQVSDISNHDTDDLTEGATNKYATTSNVTAAGALMDSEVTNLAQVKAFDSADYATAAQGTTADSALQDITGESIKDLSDVYSSMTPTDGQVLTYDTTNGWQSETLPASGMSDLVDDTTPQLGGGLDLNSNDITGTGNINITGDITASATVNAVTVDLGNWTVTESSGVLYFATGGTNKMKLDASGNLTVAGDITAFGTV